LLSSFFFLLSFFFVVVVLCWNDVVPPLYFFIFAPDFAIKGWSNFDEIFEEYKRAGVFRAKLPPDLVSGITFDPQHPGFVSGVSADVATFGLRVGDEIIQVGNWKIVSKTTEQIKLIIEQQRTSAAAESRVLSLRIEREDSFGFSEQYVANIKKARKEVRKFLACFSRFSWCFDILFLF